MENKSIQLNVEGVLRLQAHLEKAYLMYTSALLRDDVIDMMRLIKEQTGVDLEDVMPQQKSGVIDRPKRMSPEEKLELIRKGHGKVEK